MDNETVERCAREAYAAWRDHFGHVTMWYELTPQAQVVWLNVAHAAIAEAERHDKGSSHE